MAGGGARASSGSGIRMIALPVDAASCSAGSLGEETRIWVCTRTGETSRTLVGLMGAAGCKASAPAAGPGVDGRACGRSPDVSHLFVSEWFVSSGPPPRRGLRLTRSHSAQRPEKPAAEPHSQVGDASVRFGWAT